MFIWYTTRIRGGKNMPVINGEERNDLQNYMPQVISSLFADEEYAFEVFILMKGNRKLKKFVLYEGAPEYRNNTEINFKKKFQIAIADVIKEKYGSETAEYDLVENIADNQNKFYVIPQTEEYMPFEVLASSSTVNESYRVAEREAAEGIFFRYEREGIVLWAFQYFWPNAIPNRKGIRFHIIPQDDVFIELKKPILAVTKKVDLLVIANQIITNDTALLQSHYDFQQYVRTTATHIVSEINTLDLVSNMSKVTEYISRSKLTYAKKMMRLKNSKVLAKSKEELYTKITTLPRWRGKFEINERDHTITLKNYSQVENLIDLLDERYTRSDVSGEEYDTRVKKWIEPVG